MNRSLAAAYRAAAREERKPAKVTYPPWVVVPPECSEVAPGLFMGKRPKSYAGFDLVVSCERDVPTIMRVVPPMMVFCPLEDVDAPPDEKILHVASFVARVVRAGGRALVHCQLGLNRSGLVTALALAELRDCSRREALEHLRFVHGESVLSNRSFERWLVGE